MFVGATSGRPRAFTERPYEAARAIRESPLRMGDCSSEFAGGETPPLRMGANPRRKASTLVPQGGFSYWLRHWQILTQLFAHTVRKK